MDDLRERLVSDAFLHDDPDSYIAGIDAVLTTLRTSGRTVDITTQAELALPEKTSA